ncbi:MAG: OmpA family protein [Spirosomaceae bacterium]|nr:OmpA family protein [Spirosomataceae bacterium]
MKSLGATIVTLLLIGLSYSAIAQKITTLSPYIERQSQNYVEMTKVELTETYTIISFIYKNPERGGRNSELDRVFPGIFRESSTQWIQIDPRSRLYKPGDAAKKFRFVKAEGIPVSPDSLIVKPGQEVRFKVYFRRLDPGIEVFDFFEGQNNGRQQFWNYYGVHIRNPKNTPKPEPKKEIPPVVAEKPTTPPAQEPPKTTPLPTPTLVTVRGTVIDAKTKKPVAAKINYLVPSEENGLDSLQLSASSGKFKINLEGGNKYSYTASANGYFPASGAFDLTQAKGGQEVTNEILLSPVAVGESVTLSNIYFDTGKYELLSASSAELDRLVQFMRDNARMEIRVEGHTDNLGDFDQNVALSQNRANAVKKYLVGKGIDSARIEAKGFGPTRPVSKGTSESERRRNRRVEFVVVKM